MEFHILQTLPLPSLVPDALVAVGVGVALLVGLAFTISRVLLLGLLTALGGSQPDPRREFPEFGPVAGPIIAEPALPRATPAEASPHGHPVARAQLWRHLAGCATPPLAPPMLALKR